MSFKSVLRRSSRRSTRPGLTVWPLEGTWGAACGGDVPRFGRDTSHGGSFSCGRGFGHGTTHGGSEDTTG